MDTFYDMINVGINNVPRRPRNKFYPKLPYKGFTVKPNGSLQCRIERINLITKKRRRRGTIINEHFPICRCKMYKPFIVKCSQFTINSLEKLKSEYQNSNINCAVILNMFIYILYITVDDHIFIRIVL